METQIPMQRRGEDYYGRCTLHTDRTPSFTITPSKNRFYCFGCGRGGGIIEYLKEYEGRRFNEAVEQAARLSGVDLDKMCRSETMIFLKKLKKWSQKRSELFCHTVIPEEEYRKFSHSPVPEWIEEGIPQETLDTFDVRVDDTANRIVYPVRDIDSRLINIKGRTRYRNFKDLRIPKYINYYEIGVMDYLQSLDMALPFIRERREVVVFESVKSVMKAWSWGQKNCVSAEKHTLTPEQILLLAKLRADVVFAYDTDVDYVSRDVKKDIDRLKNITNVFVISDMENLLGGAQTKNAPADCGKDVWETLYHNKRRVV